MTELTLKNRKEERGNSLSITVMPMEKNRSVTVGNKVKRVPGARPQGRRSCGSRNAVVGNQRKTAMKVGLAFAVLAILLLFLFLLPPFMQTTDASTRKMRVVGYESVRVHRGETLTSIAMKRTDGSKYEVRTFIEETSRMNGIDPDRITAGNYICVPIFAY